MGVTGIGSGAAITLASITQMKSQLDDLQRQLGSGIKSTTYAGLGLDSGLTVGLRSQLNSITGYQSTITQVGVRLNLMQTALSQFSSVTQKTQSAVLQSQYVLGGSTQTQDQKTAVTTLDSLFGMLNTAADGRYLFSGSTVNQPPVDTTDHILNGDGTKAGLKQVIDERQQADLGTGNGRLTIGAAGTAVSVAADASPFGFKLTGITSNVSPVTLTQPATPNGTMSIDLGATNPSPGDTVRFSFSLPDGTTQDVTLTATTSSPPAAGQFTIGAIPSDTATNISAALNTSMTSLANTQLVAASAIQAGNEFFDTDATHPPLRVNGSPPSTSTGLVDGTANTVAWYQGDNATTDPRSTAVARADQSLSVGYGARANEEGLRTQVKNIAVFAAMQFSAADPNGQAQYTALRQRVGANLNGSPSQQTVADISGQLAGAQVALNNANDRHNQSNTTLQNLLQSVQGAPQEQVAAQILTLQTSLQATLQTTAMLLKTSIINYL
jgi:flagellin-like hook-associated protein FlgL